MCCRTTAYDNGSAVKIRYIMMGRSVRVNNRMDPFPSIDLLILIKMKCCRAIIANLTVKRLISILETWQTSQSRLSNELMVYAVCLETLLLT
jgi:hypothetical protein